MAHNFSNLGEIHSCPSFIAWYYWIIKHNYFLQIEWDFLCPHRPFPPQRPPRAVVGRGGGFCLSPGPHCSFYSRLYNWFLQTEVNFPLWFPTKVAWVLGGNQRRNCFQVPPGLLAWLWKRTCQEVQGARALEAYRPGFELSYFPAKCPEAGGLLKAQVYSSVK